MMVLEKTLESSLDWEEIQPVHPKGKQSWIFIGRTDAEDGIIDVMDMSLSKFWEFMMDREDWRAAVHGFTKSQTQLRGWTELNWSR